MTKVGVLAFGKFVTFVEMVFRLSITFAAIALLGIAFQPTLVRGGSSGCV